jgi:hypothetical protein
MYFGESDKMRHVLPQRNGGSDVCQEILESRQTCGENSRND